MNKTQENIDKVLDTITKGLKREGMQAKEIEARQEELQAIARGYGLIVQCLWYRLTSQDKRERLLEKYKDEAKRAKKQLEKHNVDDLIYTYRFNYTNLYQAKKGQKRKYHLSKKDFQDFMTKLENDQLKVQSKPKPKAKTKKTKAKKSAKKSTKKAPKEAPSISESILGIKPKNPTKKSTSAKKSEKGKPSAKASQSSTKKTTKSTSAKAQDVKTTKKATHEPVKLEELKKGKNVKIITKTKERFQGELKDITDKEIMLVTDPKMGVIDGVQLSKVKAVYQSIA